MCQWKGFSEGDSDSCGCANVQAERICEAEPASVNGSSYALLSKGVVSILYG